MADPTTLVIVVTGNSRAFSAGAERSLLNLTNTADRATAKEQFTGLLEALSACEKRFSRPLVEPARPARPSIGSSAR
jgi:enoyl-CoA hydratase/carnithine racemase